MNMIEVKVAELIGPGLDWAVAEAIELNPKLNFILSGLCTGFKIDDPDEKFVRFPHTPEFCPSTDWGQGGPLIDKYVVSIIEEDGSWMAYAGDLCAAQGLTPLTAACRAIVAAKMGGVVSVPAELVQERSQ